VRRAPCPTNHSDPAKKVAPIVGRTGSRGGRFGPGHELVRAFLDIGVSRLAGERTCICKLGGLNGCSALSAKCLRFHTGRVLQFTLCARAVGLDIWRSVANPRAAIRLRRHEPLPARAAPPPCQVSYIGWFASPAENARCVRPRSLKTKCFARARPPACWPNSIAGARRWSAPAGACPWP
jgi:hypothetical protein